MHKLLGRVLEIFQNRNKTKAREYNYVISRAYMYVPQIVWRQMDPKKKKGNIFFRFFFLFFVFFLFKHTHTYKTTN